MAGRGPQTFKKRQKEQQRKEKQQEKIAKRLARKDGDPSPETEEEDYDPFADTTLDRPIQDPESLSNNAG
jgi:hypothetical protein